MVFLTWIPTSTKLSHNPTLTFQFLKRINAIHSTIVGPWKFFSVHLRFWWNRVITDSINPEGKQKKQRGEKLELTRCRPDSWLHGFNIFCLQELSWCRRQTDLIILTTTFRNVAFYWKSQILRDTFPELQTDLSSHSFRGWLTTGTTGPGTWDPIAVWYPSLVSLDPFWVFLPLLLTAEQILVVSNEFP